MALPTRQLADTPYTTELPSPICFRTACVPADAAYPVHSHLWGEFVYTFSGVMEVKVGGQQYLVPTQYGLWLPPHVEHQGLNRYEACHCSLYVAEPICHALPSTTCALTMTPLVSTMLEHLKARALTPPYSEEDQRLLQVLVDQLAMAECVGSYLPSSVDPLLAPILAQLDSAPGDNATLTELANRVHTTERTLIRRCQRDLGMSLAEWRQRLRVIKALPMLEAGDKVESIALDLGYASSSAFINMFRRLMGVTPDEYRKGLNG
ncbi:helix-turn-helix transcriptional regulator [Marinobacterium sp. D7]|uniref:AraC family transcriptional regulator n=1 Tax=Marinobacterium ramblicola TaxID=2849041 RepID=UPI001C2DD88C|nr:helix-turn-helix transcriptional regulator [Marinobacterium ramblicola]MBV1789648.1 helix-turn-helix transcriptional regulator [Marinobacterium ramblicola]